MNDKGLVLTLIPPETDSELLTSVRKVAESVANIREAVTSAIELYRAGSALPFVSLPQPDPESWGKVGDLVTTLQTGVQDLTTAITEFRSAASGDHREGHGWRQPGGRRAEQRRDNAELARYSTARCTGTGGPAQQTIPIAITVAMIVLTLFMAWVAYTQIVVMRGAWRKLRAPAVTSDVALPSAEVSG